MNFGCRDCESGPWGNSFWGMLPLVAVLLWGKDRAQYTLGDIQYWWRNVLSSLRGESMESGTYTEGHWGLFLGQTVPSSLSAMASWW